ncbi:MAG: UDP-N-acetylmuramoyl-tripeptide--D-alanyl-D-alanine ligase [Nitrospinae bacterium]|nr:UDP-N-acetylmuramoyl-tripeptide--D-alanyl-D-alanine ligase [Nitrospinota bacterium]
MAKFDVERIAEAVNGRLICGDVKKVAGVATNSREVTRGCLFVAIIGERLDGHDFVREAFNAGAAAAIVSNPFLLLSEAGKTLILVENTVRALQDLAAYHRRRFKKLLVVGVTGSNGKTTVKNMAAKALSAKFKTLKTEGNLNNHIGVPLTLLNLDRTHKAAVIEMGMNSPGEIARLTQIAAPSIGVITNIGAAHIGRLGSLSAVRRAKEEIVVGMGQKGTAVLNASDPNSAPIIKKKTRKTITFGARDVADVELVDAWTEKNGRMIVVSHKGKETAIRLGLLGLKDVENALAAFAVGLAAKVKPEKIAAALGKVKAEKMRMEPLKLPNGVLVINDAYNANPQSSEAALQSVAAMKKPGKFYFVFGDMLELGAESENAHRRIGKLAAKSGVDAVFALGKMAALAAAEAGKSGVRGVVRKTHWELAGAISGCVHAGDTVLVKGSRGMAMERAVTHLVEILGG